MASLVLGVAGGLAFGPIGFLVGSMLGNLLFPQKQEGPRLSDLRLTGSAYGQMIPIPYGTVRNSPQIVWQTDLQEHEHTQGGKGGPEVTTFTYSASWAAKVAKGPIAKFLKIWLDSTLVYDVTPESVTDNSAINVTFYLGVETALPDPTIEAVLGVGWVPAFRDDCAAVFNAQDLSPYGNRLPQQSFLYCTSLGNVPVRVATWRAPFEPNPNGNGYGVVGVNLVAGVLNIGVYEATAGPTTTSMTYILYTFDLQGVQQSATAPVVCPPPFGANRFAPIQCANDSTIAFGAAFQQGGGNPDASCWYVSGAIIVQPVAPALGTDSVYSCIAGSPPFLYQENLYVIGGGGNAGQWIARYPAPGNIPLGGADAYYIFPAGAGGYQVTVGDDGFVYVSGPSAPAHTPLMKLDTDLNLIHQYTSSDTPAVFGGSSQQFKIHDGMILFGGGQAAYAYTIGTPFVSVGTLPLALETPAIYPMVDLGGCYAIGNDGVFSMCGTPTGVTLASILSDVSVREGMTTADIDVTEQTQIVDGFLLTKQSDGRAAIAPLQRTYYVDGVERAGKFVFVNRGGDAILTIPDNDLAAHTPGTTPPPIVTIVRAQEVDLPAIVNTNYVNEGQGWQTGSQQATRQVTLSEAVSTIDLAVVMFDAKAKQVAYVLLFEAWMQRVSFTLLTSRQYSYLEPTDVISAHGYTLRIMRKSDVASGIIQFDCVETVPAIYVLAMAGSGGSGWDDTTPGVRQATTLLLLDISLLQDSDDHTALYAAMAGAINNTWHGAVLYKSIDGGSTYVSAATASEASVIGTASDAMADFGGGNQFDESSHVDVVIGVGGGTLAGATELAVLGGANEVLLGSEILQFKNADLIAASTYRLSGLLRGRRNTEQFTGTHTAGERFVGAPFVQIPTPTSDLYQTRQFKPVTFGRSLAVTLAQNFADTGNVLTPYSPAQVGGGADASGNVTVNWIPRTRFGGAWVDYVDIGQSDPPNVVVQFCDASYTVFARVVTGLLTPTCPYTAAQQTTDFGRVQAQVFGTVANVGPFKLGTQTRFVINAGGAGNDLPITPVQPYVLPPIGPPPGPTNPTNIEITWPAYYYTGTGPVVGQTFVGHFTTGGSIPLTGAIVASEYADAAHMRRAWIATDSGGINVVPGTLEQGTTVSASVAGLAASTSYYWIMQIVNPDGSPDGVPGSHVGTVINLANVT